MSVFNTSRVVKDLGACDLESVIQDVTQTFKSKGYRVEVELLATGGAHISLTNRNLFKTVLGLKTALNAEVQPNGDEWKLSTEVGVFGQQAVPTVIMLFIAWPVLLTQIWGLVRQAKLDDEVVDALEAALRLHKQTKTDTAKAEIGMRFCTQCGQQFPKSDSFCPKCRERN